MGELTVDSRQSTARSRQDARVENGSPEGDLRTVDRPCSRQAGVHQPERGNGPRRLPSVDSELSTVDCRLSTSPQLELSSVRGGVIPGAGLGAGTAAGAGAGAGAPWAGWATPPSRRVRATA